MSKKVNKEKVIAAVEEEIVDKQQKETVTPKTKKSKDKIEVQEVKTEVKPEEPNLPKIDGRKLGNDTIYLVTKKLVNGVQYNNVETLNGQTFLLSDKDLDKQIIKE